MDITEYSMCSCCMYSVVTTCPMAPSFSCSLLKPANSIVRKKRQVIKVLANVSAKLVE